MKFRGCVVCFIARGDNFGVVVAIMLGSLVLGVGYVGASLAPTPLTFALMHLFVGVAMVRAPSRDRGRPWPPATISAVRCGRRCLVAMATGGWRHTYLGVGMFCVLATLPFIFALRRREIT
jgi:hypothetical protein